jgi:GT2 family glycosyltransferase
MLIKNTNKLREIMFKPLRVVCATRLPREKFLSQTQTGRSIESFISSSKVEVRLYADNFNGLSYVYNQAIEESLESPAILVFMHDDILITDYFYEKRIREGLKQFDIIGLAGNKRRIARQAGWRTLNLDGDLDIDENLSGAIGHGPSFPPQFLYTFGPTEVECKLMDGLFLAADSQTLKETGLRFDERFNFHFYDLDFCRQAEIKQLKMGTIPLSVVHLSGGNMDQVWRHSYDEYIKKWGE